MHTFRQGPGIQLHESTAFLYFSCSASSFFVRGALRSLGDEKLPNTLSVSAKDIFLRSKKKEEKEENFLGPVLAEKTGAVRTSTTEYYYKYGAGLVTSPSF